MEFASLPFMEHVLNYDDVSKLRKALLERKETIAVAEYLIAGLLQVAIAGADDAIRFFQGGITAYNLGQKSRHLMVEPIHALACNCVSDKVASEMALDVCRLLPESGNKIFCHYAIAHNGKVIMKKKISVTDNDAFAVQLKYVHEVIKVLLGKLE